MKLQKKWAWLTTALIVAAALMVFAADVMSELMPDIMRAEEAAQLTKYREKYDFATARAVAQR